MQNNNQFPPQQMPPGLNQGGFNAMPPNQGYPQGFPQQQIPPQGMPPQGFPPQQMPPQGFPPQAPGYMPGQDPQFNMGGIQGSPTPNKPQSNNTFVKLLSVIVAIGAVFYLLSYAYNVFVPSGTNFASVKSATVGQTYQGDVLIVRDETVYDDEGITNIQYVAAENSHVARSNVVCYVYTSGYSQRERTSLQNYREQIKLYQIELLNNENTFDQKMDRLVADVNTRALEVRSIVQGGSGNMLNLENVLINAIDSRQIYFREKYAEDQRLSRLYDDEITQLKRIESWKKQNHASFDAIVSFYTDGYEYGLTTKNFEEFSPAQVQRMINGEKPEETAARRGRTDIYRMVREGDWYALMLINNSTWNPVQGNTLRLTLEQFSNTTVDATIQSFAKSGNNLLLRLRISSNVQDVMYIRSCRAQIGEYSDAISVPERALFTQNDTLGVVVVRGTEKLFVPVELISKANGEAYIKPQYANTLHIGDTVQLF